VETEALSTGAIALGLGAALFLVLTNGFFVAAEFALVGARKTRIDAMARRGVPGARYASLAIHRLDHYISGTQLGITLSSLGLGWFGEATISSILIQLTHGMGEPFNVIASHVVAGSIAFAMITFLHIVLGELAPKSLALLFPERTSVSTAGLLILFSRIMAPFIAVLNGAANLLLRMVGLKAPTEMERVHRPEEIEMILTQMHQHRQIGIQPVQMIRGVFHLGSRTAEEIMTPRPDIVALSEDSSMDEAMAKLLETGFSRLPVYRSSIDQIIGVILALDVWRAREKGVTELAGLIRPVPYMPDSKPLEDLLAEMRRDQIHLVVVLDEFGGTRGIVTMEDIVEEVIGEIHDEDELVSGRKREHPDGSFTIAGNYVLSDLNDELGLDLPTDLSATIAGFMMNKLGRVPVVGDVVEFRGGQAEVVAMAGRRIAQVRLRRTSDCNDAEIEEAPE
jgi:putative hemolysin